MAPVLIDWGNAGDAAAMTNHFNSFDWLLLLGYFVAVVALGLCFRRSSQTVEGFTAANRSLPGWAIGLSMFGSYVSSISFLANPGKAYASNWNSLVFSLATPFAAAIAVRWFVPFYRASGDISAYEHLERRFGPWARTYAVVCFLLVQTARMGTVFYLLAIAVAPLTGWGIERTILVTGVVMTLYTFLGGIRAVVWTGVLQSMVLVSGTLICLAAIMQKVPGGLIGMLSAGLENHKFSLGSFGPSLTEPTFWVVFAYGLVINVSNFAIDQSYIQRYITARTNREAAKCVWMTAILYVPISMIFFFIGTGLYVFYGSQPELLGSIMKADEVFPHFISTQLPLGMAGLVVAAIFAASMDSNLNSMATLTYCDLYKRYFRPHAGEREAVHVLQGSTVVWGVISTLVGLLMIRAESVLDTWWQLAGILSGGMLGLLLLGMFCRTAKSSAAFAGVVVGTACIAWMTFSPSQWGPIEVRARVRDQDARTIDVDTDLPDQIQVGHSLRLKYSWVDTLDGERKSADERGQIAAVDRDGQTLELRESLKSRPVGDVAIFVESKWNRWRSPFHPYLTMVFGTCAVLAIGIVVARLSEFRASERATTLADQDRETLSTNQEHQPA